MITDKHKQALIERLHAKEGLVLKMYKDSLGILTIGYGHNLEAKPISRRAAAIIFEDDLEDAMSDAQKIPEYHMLCSARRAVLTEMVYNMGLHAVMKFIAMRSAIVAGKYGIAAAEMLNSRWAHQVGKRANELAAIMETGIYKP